MIETQQLSARMTEHEYYRTLQAAVGLAEALKAENLMMRELLATRVEAVRLDEALTRVEALEAEKDALKTDLARYDEKDRAKTAEINILVPENRRQLAEIERLRGAFVERAAFAKVAYHDGWEQHRKVAEMLEKDNQRLNNEWQDLRAKNSLLRAGLVETTKDEVKFRRLWAVGLERWETLKGIIARNGFRPVKEILDEMTKLETEVK